jgi:hypothetical protein
MRCPKICVSVPVSQLALSNFKTNYCKHAAERQRNSQQK